MNAGAKRESAHLDFSVIATEEFAARALLSLALSLRTVSR